MQLKDMGNLQHTESIVHAVHVRCSTMNPAVVECSCACITVAMAAAGMSPLFHSGIDRQMFTKSSGKFPTTIQNL